ncbi:unnamed protein product [Closterium sp. NIES-53]
MEFTVRFRVPTTLLKTTNGSNGDAISLTSGNTSSSITTTNNNSGSNNGSSSSPDSVNEQITATITQPAASSHVNYSISVDPQEPLQSAFNKLFQSHLPHCCLLSQQTRQQQDGVDTASDEKGQTDEQKQTVRFMAVGQVVYLSPEASPEKVKLKAGSVVKELPLRSREAGGKGKPDSRVIATGSSSSSVVANHTSDSAPASAPGSAPASAPVSAHPAPATGGNSKPVTNTGRRGSSSRRIRPSITRPLDYETIPRPHMVHHVDVNLPWNHSLRACCLTRILHPATPTAYQTATPNTLRLHLQQTVWGVGGAGTLRLPLRLLVGFKWKADIAPMPSAEGMFLEWMVEPRVGLLWDLDVVRCQLADMMKIHDLVAASGGVTAVGATTAAATAARATTSRASSAVVATASGATAGGGAPKHFWWQAERQASRQAGKGGGRQAGGEAEEDCFGSILVQCGGDNEGAQGSGDAAGSAGGAASGMVITGVDLTDFALRAALTLCVPLAAVYGMQALTEA